MTVRVHVQKSSGLVLLVLLSTLLMTGCPPANNCLQCGTFGKIGELLPIDGVLECSGLVASQNNPGILWTHNDSGDSARIFAVEEDGTLRGIYHLQGASATDWEDMAWGPCSGPGWADCLYIGDIGDNGASRAQIQVYRVAEPVVPMIGLPVEETLTDVELFICEYPDSAHDAETLLVDPVAGIPYIVTKEGLGSTGVYRFPATPVDGETAILESVTVLAGRSLLTGGDVSPDGSRVILRGYLNAFDYPLPESGLFEDMFSVVPCPVTLTAEPQGEALAIGPTGLEVFTASEWHAGPGAPIHKAVCTNP